MALDLETEDGTITAYVTMQNGRLAFSTRSTDRPTHVAEFTAAGLMDVDGNYINCTCAEVGPITLSYTTNEDGEQVPDQVDTRFHANTLLDLTTTQRRQWEKWVLSWMVADDAPPNSSEQGKTTRGIDLIEMSTISNPRNRIG